MKIELKILVIGISMMMLNSCDKDDSTEPENNSINKIMLLGDSREEGSRPDFESFRYELWKNLLDNDQIFDFIGTNYDDASYPDYSGQRFDRDHEGHGGYKVGDILAEIANYINSAGVPDIVIFGGLGGNDALQGVSTSLILSNTNALVDYIQDINPNAIIFIDQLPPTRSTTMTPELGDQIEEIHTGILDLAAAQTNANSQVVVVDCFTGFNDSFLVTGDDSHYNEAGAK